MKQSIYGREISRKQVSKGLGDPKIWEKEKKKLMKEYRRKPVLDSLSRELYKVSWQMEKLGIKMDYYGGFGEMGKHGRELIGAAIVARGWADGIESEI